MSAAKETANGAMGGSTTGDEIKREEKSDKESKKRKRESSKSSKTKASSDRHSSRKRHRDSHHSSSRSSRRGKDKDEKKRKRGPSSRKDEDAQEEAKRSRPDNELAENERKEKEAQEREEENAKLEQAMKRRKELLEAWRAQKRKEEEEKAQQEGPSTSDQTEQPERKAWSLDDDDEDEEEGKAAPAVVEHSAPEEEGQPPAQPPQESAAEEPEVDPLDLYMADIQKAMQKLHHAAPAVVAAAAPPKKQQEASVPAERNLVRSKLGDKYYADDEEPTWEAVGEEDEKSFLEKQKKTRVIPRVDHSQEKYEPFRKNFYIEVPEIKRMTPEEVKAYRKQHLEGVKVRGKNCPKPIKDFSQCGLSSKIFTVMKKSNYDKPTPIQAQAIPAIMSGRDIIGCAKTGSGKTLAFLLPMLRHILDQRPLEQGEGPIGLIMAPTRELALQIHSECKKFCKPLNLRAVCVYGGSGVADQISKLKRGAEIVVCTPGRMIDILCTNNGRICNMKRVTFLVLDEADRMFDMGFEPQIMRIIENIRPTRQTVMFSATFPRPVETAARKILRKPLEIVVGGRSRVCGDVEQTIEVRSEDSKFPRLLELLEVWKDKGSILIFVDTQESVDEMFSELVRRKCPCLAIHGGHDQADRDSAISDFKKGVKNILVATSVMSRGLDVPELNLVINFDCPNHLEDYVHRVGRTGRAGRKGWAYTFVTPEQDKYAPDLVKALKDSKTEVPPELQQLADAFKAKKTAGLAASHGSGFGGKGFLFNEEEALKKKKDIKQQKKAMGLDDVDSSDEEEQPGEEDEGPSGLAGTAAAAAAATPAAAAPAAATAPTAGTSGVLGGVTVRNLPAGMSVPGLVRAPAGGAGAAAAQPAAKSVQEQAMQQILSGMTASSGQGLTPTQSEAARKAALLTMQLNLKKGLAMPQQEHFTTELEINDYPQQARWKVTHKDALYQITEMTGAAITTRGTYFKPGQPVPLGERKLYLYIEGPTEASVKQARTEIKRVLEDAAALAHPERPTGRYGFNFG